MIYPSRKEFIELSKKGNLIPVFKEITADMDTPVSSFMKIDKSDYSYLLESVEGQERIARYSFLGSDPSVIISSRGSDIEIAENGSLKRFRCRRDPVDEIKSFMRQFEFVPIKGLPRFCGGLVGYLGYDMVRFFEDIPASNPDELKMPDAVFMLTDTLLIFDHMLHKIKIVSNVRVKKSARAAYDAGVAKITEIERRLSKNVKDPVRQTPSKPQRVSWNYSKKAFCDMVKKAKRYIRAGDIIQVVLSQRLKVPLGEKDPFTVYRNLRSINPSPYMYYLKFKDMKLIGSSPEIMVRCEDGRIELRPIAGTRPRGRNLEEDDKLAGELLADAKEKAEHLMLVDLGRNDVGRVSDFKTVKVKEFMKIEKYSHVMHIVSDIVGRLSRDRDEYDLIRASFPAGTVSGAPKIRAMEIIDELENTRRGPYAGCVGYFSFSKNVDTCITIRTIIVKGGSAYIQAGAGIVADSKPLKEYEETLNKAKALIKALDNA